MKQAIIAIEDRASTPTSGVDLRGIARALVQDVAPSRRRPGRLDDHAAVRQERARRPERPHASSRSCARPRSPTSSRASGPRSRSSRNYLNTIYFGNGAYGIESAARDLLRRTTTPAAASAGQRAVRRAAASRRRPRCSPAMVASPSGYDPLQHPAAAERGATSCSAHARAGLHHARSSTTRAAHEPLPDARATSSRRARTRSTRTSRPGSSSRSSTSSAAARPARGARSRAA